MICESIGKSTQNKYQTIIVTNQPTSQHNEGKENIIKAMCITTSFQKIDGPPFINIYRANETAITT